MPEDSKYELPDRYDPLVEYISTNFPEQTAAFKLACQLIEERRLQAEQTLRRIIGMRWGASKEGLKDISPFNTVHSFQNFYVVRILDVVGSTCAGLFHNS